MTDPFYQNNKLANNGQPPVQGAQAQGVTNSQQTAQQVPQQQGTVSQTTQQQLTPQQQAALQQQRMQQLQQLNAQEQQIRQQLQQLDNILKTRQLVPQQQQQVARQIQQLNMQLQYILQQKAQLGVGGVNKPVVHPNTKKSSGVSIKGVLLGCMVLLIFLIGGGAGVFYSFVQSPEKLTSMGLSVDTAKNLLKAMVSVGFGLLTILGFGLLIVNVYRLFTVKNKSKISNVLGSILGIFLLGGAIAGWTNLLAKINTIAPTTRINADDLVLAYASYKDGNKLITPKTQLIAPMIARYELNVNLFTTQVLSKLGPIDNNNLSISLDCGNDRKLNLDLATATFDGSCMYMDKGEYPLSISIDYINAQTQEKLNQVVQAGKLTVQSALKLVNYGGDIKMNAAQTELILGKVPHKITFDATQVFADFGLGEYKITWDVNDDGEVDKENDASFTYVYNKAKVYNVNFRIPELNDILYSFPIRIEQSDVPICEVSYDLIKSTEYGFTTTFVESNETITDYVYSVIDIGRNKIIDTLSRKSNYLKYKFPGSGVFAVKTTFQTAEGKKGECESNNVVVGSSSFNIHYDILAKTPSAPDFVALDDTNNKVKLEDKDIILTEIPTILKIKINKIIPDTPGAKKKVLLDGKAILSLDETNFEIPIEESKDHKISIVVEDVNRDIKTQEDYTVKVKRKDIIGKIIIKPDTVGKDPFEVHFDASTTVVNDPDDEIIYFTRDFGDGDVKKNISQAVIDHVYKYDYEKENGVYNPTLTITTKKGREVIVKPDTAIIVQKPQRSFTINIDSHPGQLAKVGDLVQFSLELNGLPERVIWYYGDGNTLNCKARECIETSYTYTEPGVYNVEVEVYEANNTTIKNSIKLKVQ